MYQCQMGKQTMGTPFHAKPHRTDTKTYTVRRVETGLASGYRLMLVETGSSEVYWLRVDSMDTLSREGETFTKDASGINSANATLVTLAKARPLKMTNELKFLLGGLLGFMLAVPAGIIQAGRPAGRPQLETICRKRVPGPATIRNYM